MKLYTLYVANRLSGLWEDADQKELFGMVTAIFPGFTVTEAQGFFQGRPTPTLVVSIATDDAEAVRNLGERIRVRFIQQAVGMTVDGTYYRLAG